MITFADQEMGASFEVGDIPADLADSAAEWREKLLEQVVELDDAVMEKYLDVRHPLALPPARLFLSIQSLQVSYRQSC